jgi:hypothetical protein
MYVKKVWRIVKENGGREDPVLRDFFLRGVIFAYQLKLQASQTAALLLHNMLNPAYVPKSFDPTEFIERYNWSKQ